MPTWPALVNTRSPGRISARLTARPRPASAPVWCGNDMPSRRYAATTRPLQSKLDGPLVPCRYALPTCARANPTTVDSAPPEGGAGTGCACAGATGRLAGVRGPAALPRAGPAFARLRARGLALADGPAVARRPVA